MKTQMSFQKSMQALLLILCVGIFSAFVSAPAVHETASTSESHLMKEEIGGAHLLFAGKYGGDIRKSDFMGKTELQVEGCAKGSKIFTYTLEVNQNGKMTKLQGKSDSLTKEMVTALNALNRGDSFEFKSTKAYLPNGKDVVDVSSSKFVVV
jgi:hypothetical protein